MPRSAEQRVETRPAHTSIQAEGPGADSLDSAVIARAHDLIDKFKGGLNHVSKIEEIKIMPFRGKYAGRDIWLSRKKLKKTSSDEQALNMNITILPSHESESEVLIYDASNLDHDEVDITELLFGLDQAAIKIPRISSQRVQTEFAHQEERARVKQATAFMLGKLQ